MRLSRSPHTRSYVLSSGCSCGGCSSCSSAARLQLLLWVYTWCSSWWWDICLVKIHNKNWLHSVGVESDLVERLGEGVELETIFTVQVGPENCTVLHFGDFSLVYPVPETGTVHKTFNIGGLDVSFSDQSCKCVHIHLMIFDAQSSSKSEFLINDLSGVRLSRASALTDTSEHFRKRSERINALLGTGWVTDVWRVWGSW